MTLTRAGEAAYLTRDAPWPSCTRSRRACGPLGGERTVVRVALFQTAAAELLPAALALLREEWPGVEVELTETDDDPRLVDWLAQGRLDLAITINQQPDDRIEVIRLFDDPWVILTRRDSTLASVERPSFDCWMGRMWWRGLLAGRSRKSSRRPGDGVGSSPMSCTGPTTTSRSSAWSRPGWGTPAWGAWRRRARSTPR